MAYIEVRKAGKLVMQKQVDGELARKGVRIRVGTVGNVHLKLGQSKTVGDYVVTLYEGQPSEDAYHAVDDLKKAVGAFPPIDAPKAQDVTISADAEEQKKYPRIEGFEITGRLGEGGMGTVWRGVQLSTKREVAIKFLSAHRFASEKAKTRFEREVAMAAKLNHPNIAQIYDSGVHRGVYYYAMELIEGDHLDKYVQREELSPKEIIKLLRDVCDAVCHAHQHGIIHRDLKPSNILVTPHGKPTIVDFGLAKSFEKEHEDATISIEGDITGTPAYMAPEQAAGRIKDISERTDVYAMGVIMYQLMAGCLPHDVSGSQYDVIRRIVEDDVIPPRTINPAIDGELESILLTCLAREPENRYPSASVLVKDIDNYLSGEPLLSKSFSTTYRVVKKFSRNRVKIALGGTFAAMLAAIVLLLCFIYSSPRPDSKTEPTALQDSTEGIISPNQPVIVNKGLEPKAGDAMTNSPPRLKEVDEAVVEQNPPQSLSFQRNPPRAAISIDGKPFFVICARSAVPEEFEEYKKAGFNTVYTHNPENPALDEAQKLGLYAIHNFPDYLYLRQGNRFPPAYWQQIKQQISQWGNHSALIGWAEPTDVFNWNIDPLEIKEIYNLIGNSDNTKSRLLFFPPASPNLKNYLDYADVLVYDSLTDKTVAEVTQKMDTALKITQNKPVWYLEQVVLGFKTRTPVQFRSEIFLAVNHGATGVLIEGFRANLWAEWEGDKYVSMGDPRLADMRKETMRIAGELKELAPAILAAYPTESAIADNPSGQLDIQTYASPDGLTVYIVAVNTTNENIETTFTVPFSRNTTCQVLNEKRTVRLQGNTFNDKFEAFQCHIYKYQRQSFGQSDQPKTALQGKWRKALGDAQCQFQSINDRESADFVGKILDSLDKPGGGSPSALAAHASRLESKTRELVREGSMESAATLNLAMRHARYRPGPGVDAPARKGQPRRNDNPSRADGLVLYMPFDALPTNSIVLDESGTGNHGRVEGAQWVQEGRFGGAYQFHITNLTDRIVIPDSNSLNPQRVTVAAWIKASDTDGFTNRVVDKDWRSGYALSLGGDGKNDSGQQTKGFRGKLIIQANNNPLVSNQTLRDDHWHHIAGTFDGMLIKLYVDGVEKKQSPKNFRQITNHWDLCIGNSVVDYETGEVLAFEGLIDEVRVYNRVLSAEEIQTLTGASQAGADIPSPILPAGDSQPLSKQEFATGSGIWNERNPPSPAISINGEPFFAICARSAVPEEFEEYKKAGFNTVYTHLPSNPALDEAQKYGLYAIPSFAYYKCKDGLFLPEFWEEAQQQITARKSHPALLAWSPSASLFYKPRKPLEIKRIYDLLGVQSPGKPRLLVCSLNDNNWKQLYQFNAYADVFVLENHSIQNNIPATALWFQRASELATGRPIWYLLHANILGSMSPSVRELRASTYLGINHGATGVLIDGFQNRLWKEWGVDVPGMGDPRLADLRKEALRIAGELETLSPAILAGSIKGETGLFDNPQLDCKAFADPENITLYFIAVNPSNQLVTSTFYVPQGMGNPIDVMNEGRTLRQTNSQFSDSFEPQETHIYILKPDKVQAPQAEHTFALGDNDFLLDGKPLQIRCGEIHFTRVPREYWQHRLRQCKAMGLNAVCAYLFWNFHEWEQGKFNWSDQADAAEFCRIAQAEGLWVILRPGPYACAEWEMGGLPWWLLKHDDIALRSRDPRFISATQNWFKKVGQVLGPLQVTQGGPILMVQVENEYGFFGKDPEYMGDIKQALLDSGFNVPLFTCSPPRAMSNGYRPDLFVVVNFDKDPASGFKALREIQPTGPLMCGEFYPGWFDTWGDPHRTGNTPQYIKDLKYMLENKASFSIYLAHGGTTFGLWTGSNNRSFKSDTSSYDYDAPISEAGWIGDKFKQTRELMAKHLLPGETLTDPAPANPVISMPPFELNETASVFDNLPAPIEDNEPKTMEQYDQGRGCILYRATIPAGPEATLQVKQASDFAWIFVDGKQVGIMDRRYNRYSVTLPARTAAAQLDILIEAMGRINFGQEMYDRKGLHGPVEIVGEKAITVTGWKVYCLDLGDKMLAELRWKQGKTDGAAFWRGTFKVEKIGDTFLDVSSWGKGVLWVNGHCMGRFWNIGPTQTMYIPGPWLKVGANEVIVLDMLGPQKAALAGVTEPVLDKLRKELDFSSK